MNRKTKLQSLLASACVALLAGCTVGPNYRRPPVPVAPAWEEPHDQTAAAATPDIAWSNWWTVFHDPVLDNLETQAADANRDIRIAVAHVDQANAMARSVHSNQLPTVEADPSVSRTREAQDSPGNVTRPGPAATYNDLLLPLTLNYEIDAWGKIRRMVQSSNATAQASAADLRFVKLSVSASVALDYFSLREADAQLRIVDATVDALQRD